MPWFYWWVGWPVRLVRFICLREVILGRERLAPSGGLLLAVTHVSHLEPAIVGLHTSRHISWVARKEFYRRAWAAWALNALRCIPVDRRSAAHSAVREAVRRIRQGRAVGIFPEGGVARGGEAVFRGGTCKAGACVIARRAGVPIVPVVILGVEKLNAPGPYLPWRRARVYTAYGRPVLPETTEGTPRELRERFADRLRAGFVATYRELLDATGIRDEEVP